jgi:NAD(P)H dehydrogenase (quinone)
MPKYLVTGATGQLGGQTIEFLLRRVAAGDVAALAREPAKLGEIAALGVDVRKGDYEGRSSLEQAFAGVERLLFVATVAFSDRLAQHRNVIEAAKAAGVGQIIYTGIQRPDQSTFVMPQVTEWEAETERLLDESGIPVTLLRNGLYTDALPFMVGEKVFELGIRAPADDGAAAIVSRRDLAEANAVLLTTEGHAGRTFTLTGPEACTMEQVARIYSSIGGRPVGYANIGVDDFLAERTDYPAPVAAFIGDWFAAIAAGEFSEVTPDLERLLGRRPTDPETVLRGVYG